MREHVTLDVKTERSGSKCVITIEATKYRKVQARIQVVFDKKKNGVHVTKIIHNVYSDRINLNEEFWKGITLDEAIDKFYEDGLYAKIKMKAWEIANSI